jgi:hypothetical protein
MTDMIDPAPAKKTISSGIRISPSNSPAAMLNSPPI